MWPAHMPYQPSVAALHNNGRLFPPNYLHDSGWTTSTGTPSWSRKLRPFHAGLHAPGACRNRRSIGKISINPRLTASRSEARRRVPLTATTSLRARGLGSPQAEGWCAGLVPLDDLLSAPFDPGQCAKAALIDCVTRTNLWRVMRWQPCGICSRAARSTRRRCFGWRMIALHLDTEAWARCEPAMFSEKLKSLCAACTSRQECAYDLAMHLHEPTWSEWRDYCPNAARLSTSGARTGIPAIGRYDRAGRRAVRRSSANSAGGDGLSSNVTDCSPPHLPV